MSKGTELDFMLIIRDRVTKCPYIFKDTPNAIVKLSAEHKPTFDELVDLWSSITGVPKTCLRSMNVTIDVQRINMVSTSDFTYYYNLHNMATGQPDPELGNTSKLSTVGNLLRNVDFTYNRLLNIDVNNMEAVTELFLGTDRRYPISSGIDLLVLIKSNETKLKSLPANTVIGVYTDAADFMNFVTAEDCINALQDDYAFQCSHSEFLNSLLSKCDIAQRELSRYANMHVINKADYSYKVISLMNKCGCKKLYSEVIKLLPTIQLDDQGLEALIRNIQ